MYVIIPLGGIGSRYAKFSFLPKPLAYAEGERILSRVLKSLNFEGFTPIIVYNRSLLKYNFENIFKSVCPENTIFLPLTRETKGAADTVNFVFENLELDESKPFISIDSDTVLLEDVLQNFRNDPDNVVYYFEDKGSDNIYSYLSLDNERVVQFEEKIRISNNACIGAYGFSSISVFKELRASSNQKDPSEQYLSKLIKSGLEKCSFKGRQISKGQILGTPKELKLWAATGTLAFYPKRFCFDLDGTLFHFPEVKGDYTTAKPVQNHINLVRFLKEQGHYIIIYTANGMLTYDGDIEAIKENRLPIIEANLQKHGVPYDEIIVGKPLAHFYIDDLAFNPYNNLNNVLGVDVPFVETRESNSIRFEGKEVYKITSNDGELYYYANIPEAVEDLFPASRFNAEGIVIERINGLSFYQLLLEDIFEEKDMKLLFNALERLHSIPPKNLGDIYANYCQKMEDRTPEELKSLPEYTLVYNKLKEYESLELGTRATIHGDSVLTNIFLTVDKQIKFIDMRGKLGNTLTTDGDKLYDYAKLWQSLNGYSEVLSLQFDLRHATELKNAFLEQVTLAVGEKAAEYLPYITASLFFTLIPLHPEERKGHFLSIISDLVS